MNATNEKPAWGTAPIKCGNRKCDWAGTEKDFIHHPADAGKFSVRKVCPVCYCDRYTFTRRKRVISAQLVTEITPKQQESQPCKI
jgi:hypothetical protein